MSVYSNIQKLPASQVFKISHLVSGIEGITLSPIGYLLEASPPVVNRYCPELFKHQIASGHTLYAMVFKPHSFQTGRKYPTILNVYGGPEVQLVSNSFKVRFLLYSNGFC